MNYVLNRLCSYPNIKAGITSIGIDGEKSDLVTNTKKPEIFLYPNTFFTTVEEFYKSKNIISNILSVSKQKTILGRLITSQSISSGKIMISGPNNNLWLKEIIDEMIGFGANIVLVDGAISRMSFGSPTITEAMILSTGANVSLDIKTIVKKTNFVYQLTELPEVEKEIKDKIFDLDMGIYSIDKDINIIDLDIPSVLLIDKYKDKLISEYKDIYFSGIITDKLLDLIINQKSSHNYRIIVKDFTKIFSSQEKTELFIRKVGKINVVNKTNLIAITVNPTSTVGYNLNSDELIDRLKQVIPIPIYNIKD